jgi:hypothetical protein
MLANCLFDSRILTGQLLHVPRLPILPTTAAPTVIPSDTPSSTPAPPQNSPTVFEPNIMTCDGPGYVAFSVSVYDEDGLVSVYVSLYTSLGTAITTIPMDADGSTYYGSDSLPKEFTVSDVGYYVFSAVDKFQDVTNSQTYNDRSASCIPIPTDTPTDIPIGQLQ